MEKAYLVLSNGRVFEGLRIGADVDAAGELIFNTSMVGCAELLTDPASAGHIVVQTFPLAGNYGINREDFEGPCRIRGYIAREMCPTPSNFRSEGSLEGFLKLWGVPGICGVDTRELARILREEGSMQAAICSRLPADSQAFKAEAAVLTTREKELFPADGEKRFAVTLIDYGARASLIRALCARGCEVTAVPYSITAEELLAAKPDGVVLSGGPGDPRELKDCTEQIASLIGRVPVFGVGLGHQLAALAMGGSVTKLLHGHRGANQPVRAQQSGHSFITTQNHGYCVDELPDTAALSLTNLNDGSCEGLEYPGLSCFTVQFVPGDAQIQKFITMMGGGQDA